jgi:ribonuclease T2
LSSTGTVVPPYTGPNIGTFLKPFAKYDLLAWMNKFWINQGAPNTDFWGHEFSKHATCFSTFDIPCYGPEYVEHEEVVDFFETAILYYRRLPTWGWLAQAGITPSNTTTYSISQFQNTLTSSYGALPYIGCSGPRFNQTAAGANSTDNGRTQISEVWYYFHVSLFFFFLFSFLSLSIFSLSLCFLFPTVAVCTRLINATQAFGRPQSGAWLPTNATGSVTSCAKTANAIHYPLRANGSVW